MGKHCHSGCHWLAKLGNVALLGLAGYVTINHQSTPEPFELGMLALLWAVPLINLAALCRGPDREERQLQTEVRKAALRQTLKNLSSGAACGCGNPACPCGPGCTCQPGCTCEKCKPAGKSGCC